MISNPKSNTVGRQAIRSKVGTATSSTRVPRAFSVSSSWARTGTECSRWNHAALPWWSRWPWVSTIAETSSPLLPIDSSEAMTRLRSPGQPVSTRVTSLPSSMSTQATNLVRA